MSCSASYSGRRYGSIFSYRVPGRKPSRSPASTAGRVRMIRVTSLACSAFTALAMARYVLPVPAGPMQNTIVWLSIASTYRFWFTVLGRTMRPRADRMSRGSTSAGRTPDLRRSIGTIRPTALAVSSAPPATSAVSSENNSATRAVSAGEPEMVISLPRTWISASNEPSITRSSSSPEPSRLTIEWSSPMITLTCVGPSGRGPGGVAPRSRCRESPDVSVNSLSPEGRRHPPAHAVPPCYPRGSARWPGQRAAAKHMGMRVEHGLTGLGPGVEDDPVATPGQALGGGHQIRHRGDLRQQPGVGGRQGGQIRIVIFRNDQHMGRRLRINVTERDHPGGLAHLVGWDIPGDDPAEKAVRHGAILACYPPAEAPAYMVA